MNIETIKAYSQNVKKIKRELTLFRFQEKNRRWYYEYDFDTDDVQFYPSVTSILNTAYPTPEFIIKLKADMGIAKYNQWLSEKAHLGTFIHEELSDIMLFGEYQFDKLSKRIEEYAEKNNLRFNYKWWHFKAKDYLMCFMKFFEDVQIEPLAVELPIKYWNEEYHLGYASLIDCVAYINVKKGRKTERKLAIIDWKTGSNVFPTHELQLQMYDVAFYDTYGMEADVMLNVFPNTTLTNYKTKMYDEINDVSKIMHYVDFYHKQHSEPKNILTTYNDAYVLNYPVNDYFKQITAAEYVKELNKTQEFIDKVKK